MDRSAVHVTDTPAGDHVPPHQPNSPDAEPHPVHESATTLALLPRPPRRLRVLLVCTSLMLVVGVIYVFPAISGRLATEMNYDETDVNLIGSAFNIGTWFGVVGGVVCDRWGPRTCTMLGAVLVAVGCLCSALACAGRLPQSSMAFSCYAFVIAQGSGWGYLSGVKVALLNFHNTDHATIVGTMVAFVALSSGVISQLYKCLLADSSLQMFFLVLMVFCCGIQVNALSYMDHLPTLQPVPDDDDSQEELLCLCDGERTAVWHIELVAVSLSLWLLLCSLTESRGPLGSVALIGLFGGIVVHVLALPGLWLCWHHNCERLAFRQSEHVGSPTDVTSERAPLSLPSSRMHSPLGSELASHRSDSANATAAQHTSDHPPAQSMLAELVVEALLLAGTLKTTDFWLLFATVAMLLGFPVTHLNNLSGLSRSMDGAQLAPTLVASCVALFSVGNCWGRLAAGSAATRLLPFVARIVSVDVVPRWGCFLLAWVAGTLANLLLLCVWSTSVLYITLPMAGFCLGATFSVAPTAVADRFTPRRFASVWSAITIAPCIATEVLGTLLAGRVADHEAQHSFIDVDNRRSCVGAACFRPTFIVTMFVSSAALATGAWFLVKLMRIPPTDVAPQPQPTCDVDPATDACHR